MAEEHVASVLEGGADEDQSMDTSNNSIRNDDDDDSSEAASSAATDQLHDAMDEGESHQSNKSVGEEEDGEEDEQSLGTHNLEDEDDEEEEEPTETNVEDDEEEDGMSIKSHATVEEASPSKDEVSKPLSQQKEEDSSGKSKPKKAAASSAKKSRTPSVQGLTIPFRTIKKSMKLDPDIPIVQNEAAIMTTLAVELFVKRLALASYRNAKNRGRNTVRYEDIAEARTNNKTLAFLETLLP